MNHQDKYGTEFEAAQHPTRTIPAAHRTRQTLHLMADNRFEDPVIHVMIVDGEGKVVAQHDAPRGALMTAIDDIKEVAPIPEETLNRATIAGAEAFGVLPDEIDSAHKDFARAALAAVLPDWTAPDPYGAEPTGETTVINNVVISATPNTTAAGTKTGTRLVNIERAAAWAAFQEQQGTSPDPVIHQHEYRAWCAAWDASKGNPWPARTNTTIEAL